MAEKLKWKRVTRKVVSDKQGLHTGSAVLGLDELRKELLDRGERMLTFGEALLELSKKK